MTDDNLLSVLRLVNEFCNQSTIINHQKEKITEIMNLLTRAVEIIRHTHGSDGSDFLFEVLPNSNLPYCLNCASIKNHQPIFMCKCKISLLCDDCVKEYKGLCQNCFNEYDYDQR
jgi:hypothetical protein